MYNYIYVIYYIHIYNYMWKNNACIYILHIYGYTHMWAYAQTILTHKINKYASLLSIK